MKPCERMKEIQTDSDLNVKTLSAKLDVNEHSMSNYLNGKREVPYDLLVKFAAHFHITADYLLGLTDDPKRPLSISDNERALLERFRSLTPEQRELILQTVAFMERQNQRR